MRVKNVTKEEVEYIAYRLAKVFLEWSEPIPDFSTRFPNILEKCLLSPHQTFNGQLYKGLVKKSAILFYLLIKNHPFQNGNKRIAVTTLLIFLMKNGKWLKLGNQELYNFSKWIAESDSELKDGVIDSIEYKIKKHLVNLDER